MKTDSLKIALANHIEASLVIQSLHWNVTGVNFPVYHEFFGRIYEMYHGRIDRLAEYIRIVDLNEYVNGSTSVISANKTLELDLVTGSDIQAMLEVAHRANQELMKNMKTLFTDSVSEPGLENYCAEVLDDYRKLNWQLSACLKK